MRRKAFKPKEQHYATKLAGIPPSESHLFEEELLAKFLDQRGGLNRVFPLSRKPLKGRPSYGTKNKPSQGSSSLGNSSFQKARTQSMPNNSFRKQTTRGSKRDYKRSDSGKKDRRSSRA